MSTQYEKFDLEAVLKDQREGKPCRIVRLSDGARAVDWKYWVNPIGAYHVLSILWPDGSLQGFNAKGEAVTTIGPAIGLMPERVEHWVSLYSPSGGLTLGNLSLDCADYVAYKITMNPDGSDPQIEIVK